ncbi:hypothetical protein FN846DRAFT_928778 [Sphaerosporella brunnea]|uniref:Mtf2-like C-terminal domain-containing protein n=1 Tax=Sphaerosporella brunnea TaxID=1250544 RepID=A0A5J5F9E6_9PEZI|nr:hypothetical protein FN846DRAFT_928778 [Sphaerosporella brunnea]
MSHCRLALRCCHSISSSTPSLLPFLYQTRSIHFSSNNARPGNIPEDDSEDIPFEPPQPTSTQKKGEDPFAYLYKPPPRQFRLPPPTMIPSPPVRKAPIPDAQQASSITLREREIFTKIFETILSTPSATNKMATSRDASPRTRGLPPPPQLQELFASTIGPQQTGTGLSFAPRHMLSEREGATEAMALASTLEAYPPSLRLAAAKAAGLTNYNLVLHGDQRQVDPSALGRLQKELRACMSDVDVLRFMEEKVYPLPADPNSPGAVHYADLLAEGMDLFRKGFNDLGSVVAVFERAKSLGAESYVLGCTTNVYNKALAAVWDGFQDVQRVRDMVEEMAVNAVGGDFKTADTIHRVCDEVNRAYEGFKGELAMMMVGKHEMITISSLRQRALNLEKFGTFDAPPPEKKKPQEPKQSKLSERPIKWASGGKGKGKGKRREKIKAY